MLFAGAALPTFIRLADNWVATPASMNGTLVTASATANTKGSWVELLGSAALTADVYWVHVRLHTSFASTVSRMGLLDIGVDLAGGTSYTVRVADIIAGGLSDFSVTGGGAHFAFPMYIPAGASIAARWQCSVGSATVRVDMTVYSMPGRPEATLRATSSQTLGTITNSLGTSVTPGTGADGSWVSLGTLSNPAWWFQVRVQIDNAAVGSRFEYLDLAYGDSTNKIIIARDEYATRTSETIGHYGQDSTTQAFSPVPSGAEIYVRLRDATTPDSGWNVLAYAFGG